MIAMFIGHKDIPMKTCRERFIGKTSDFKLAYTLDDGCRYYTTDDVEWDNDSFNEHELREIKS